MADLKTRFGRLVAVHRRRKKLTQEQLAEAAGVSIDMISKIEIGATGARFPTIERIAGALGVDEAELFTANLPGGRLDRGEFREISTRLAALSPADLRWVSGVLDAALQGRSESAPKIVMSKATPVRASRRVIAVNLKAGVKPK